MEFFNKTNHVGRYGKFFSKLKNDKKMLGRIYILLYLFRQKILQFILIIFNQKKYTIIYFFNFIIASIVESLFPNYKQYVVLDFILSFV